MPTILHFLADHWSTFAVIISVIVAVLTHGRKLKRILAELKPNGGASFRDLGDRIMRAVQRTEERQRVFTELADMGAVVEMNEAGDLVAANRAALDLFDRPLSDLEGEGWVSSVAPAHRRGVLMEWRSCVQASRVFEMRFDLLRPVDGASTAHMTVYPLISDDEVLGFTGKAVAA